jgi:hypothetical protein
MTGSVINPNYNKNKKGGRVMKKIIGCGVLLALLLLVHLGCASSAIKVNMVEPSGCSDLVCTTEKYQITFSPLTSYSQGISFSLQNKSAEPILIIWDESAFIDASGQSSRIIHSGVRLIERDAPQAPSIVVPGTSLSDSAIPSSNIYFIPGQYGGWQTRPLFFQASNDTLQGKTVGIYLMLKIGDLKQPQKFSMKIESVTQK